MNVINVSDLSHVSELSGEEMEAVKGGPIYIEVRGVDGDVTESRSGGGAHVLMGDGSVKF